MGWKRRQSQAQTDQSQVLSETSDRRDASDHAPKSGRASRELNLLPNQIGSGCFGGPHGPNRTNCTPLVGDACGTRMPDAPITLSCSSFAGRGLCWSLLVFAWSPRPAPDKREGPTRDFPSHFVSAPKPGFANRFPFTYLEPNLESHAIVILIPMTQPSPPLPLPPTSRQSPCAPKKPPLLLNLSVTRLGYPENPTSPVIDLAPLA